MPALPGCRSWGESVEEALTIAKDAVAVYLANEPDAPSGDEAVVGCVSVSEADIAAVDETEAVEAVPAAVPS